MKSTRGRALSFGGGVIAVAALAICVTVAQPSTTAATRQVAAGNHQSVSRPSSPAGSSTAAAPSSTATGRPTAVSPNAILKAAAPVKQLSAATPPPVVPGCENGCDVVNRIYVPGNAHLDLLKTRAPGPNSYGLMAYWVGNRLVAHRGLSQETPRQAEWATAGECQNDQCVVTFDLGAHSAEAVLLALDPSTGITVLDSALADASTTVISDLNQDGHNDVSLLDSTYDPSYATGPKYWTTELNEGGRFVVTGCTAPASGGGPTPTAPATGACPST